MANGFGVGGPEVHHNHAPSPAPSSGSPPAAGATTMAGTTNADAAAAEAADFVKELQAEKDSLEASNDDTIAKTNTIKLLEQGRHHPKTCRMGHPLLFHYYAHQC